MHQCRFVSTAAAATLIAAALLLSGKGVAAEDAAYNLPPGDGPPPTVFDRIANAGTADDHDGADHVIVYNRTVNRVKSSGVTYTDDYLLYKVLTPAGCRNQSVQRWRYEPWSSFV
ncbi:MAG: hypothetical protein KAS89_05685, partial [Candidatus Eisenbacteria sp.]|nr:hypothetical protein [Candidatus Eisenbacteria bacterium]